ncbi:hypothetical protein PsYK624_085200 [Phanerochaete sordida]|uniref:Uncharacterized protein n=1 Tax=Phanerochaete sordida TaxID=48140 RepID=A0A9P3LEC0_9APHY|nr:hypothetical protein PsYK624_085200 [Phanerochaete sordida]
MTYAQAPTVFFSHQGSNTHQATPRNASRRESRSRVSDHARSGARGKHRSTGTSPVLQGRHAPGPRRGKQEAAARAEQINRRHPAPRLHFFARRLRQTIRCAEASARAHRSPRARQHGVRPAPARSRAERMSGTAESTGVEPAPPRAQGRGAPRWALLGSGSSCGSPDSRPRQARRARDLGRGARCTEHPTFDRTAVVAVLLCAVCRRASVQNVPANRADRLEVQRVVPKHLPTLARLRCRDLLGLRAIITGDPRAVEARRRACQSSYPTQHLLSEGRLAHGRVANNDCGTQTWESDYSTTMKLPQNRCEADRILTCTRLITRVRHSKAGCLAEP